jgi:Fe-S-cluster-containing hydrogenase component 2
MYIPAGEKLPISCDLCGGDPQCVKYCPREVLFYATDEQVAKIKRGKLDPSQMSTQEEESSK